MQGPKALVKELVKAKKNHGFSSFDLLTTVIALMAVAVVTGPILYKNFESRSVKIAHEEIKIISENISAEIVSYKKSSKRAPTSAKVQGYQWEGVRSKDPWGRAYSYKTLKNAYGIPTHVVIWSNGPNGLPDTDDGQLRLTKGLVSFTGDDFGSVKQIR